MPISNMYFKDGIFFAKESGIVNEADAREWVAELKRYAQESPVPIIALVDALEVTAITRTAEQVFAEGSKTANVRLSSVAAGSAMMAQVSRNISLRAKRGSSYIFMKMEEARRFAEEQASLIQR